MVVTHETEMMVFDEMEPAAYPVVPPSALLVVDTGIPAWIWQRIEAYCNWRWTPREAQIDVDGVGWFNLPVRPFRVTKVEFFAGEAWEEVLPPHAEQRGWRMYSAFERCRITGMVGEDNPAPEAVIHAAIRLHAYLGHTPESFPMWATSRSHTAENTTHGEGGSTSTRNETFQRHADYLAKAIQHSGAADLLRRYRRSR